MSPARFEFRFQYIQNSRQRTIDYNHVLQLITRETISITRDMTFALISCYFKTKHVSNTPASELFIEFFLISHLSGALIMYFVHWCHFNSVFQNKNHLFKCNDEMLAIVLDNIVNEMGTEQDARISLLCHEMLSENAWWCKMSDITSFTHLWLRTT